MLDAFLSGFLVVLPDKLRRYYICFFVLLGVASYLWDI
ncbi:hypothetical Protein psc5_01140 [Candidatus Phytoplasma solani]